LFHPAAGERPTPPVDTAIPRASGPRRRTGSLRGIPEASSSKGARSPEWLLDEMTPFLHSVELTLSRDQREIIRTQYDPDAVLQDRTFNVVENPGCFDDSRR
jgi:hypothetical protein